MGGYEFYCPPVRQWPAIWKARFLGLYDAAMDRILPWRWMCALFFLPGTPSRAALDGLVDAAVSAEVATI
jgi:hypothetical protein